MEQISTCLQRVMTMTKAADTKLEMCLQDSLEPLSPTLHIPLSYSLFMAPAGRIYTDAFSSSLLIHCRALRWLLLRNCPVCVCVCVLPYECSCVPSDIQRARLCP